MTKEDIVTLSKLAAVSFAAVVVLAPATAAYAQVPYPPTVGNARVSATAVKPGGCVTFSGDGFLPASPVVVTDDGAAVTTVTTGTDGSFSTQVCPSVLGVHLIRGAGTGTNGAARVLSASVTVSATGLAGTGAANTVPMVAVGAGMILAGAGAVVVASRRRRATAVA
ncbi:MAG: hypothetical protein QOE45_1078 [Frankiaceae bacterium]|jgi:LPXTG-motif cell wall-anchored protein|nr:hypothetical protein [Frankiaceae bacterium]